MQLKKIITQHIGLLIAALVFGLIFVFWAVIYPHALSYQEENQLFLYSFDYFVDDVCTVGGLADYISEFIVQFYYYPWIGGLLQATLFVVMYICIPVKHKYLAVIPLALMLWAMGDTLTLHSYEVAFVLALVSYKSCSRLKVIYDLAIIPVLYYLVGPVAMMYALMRVMNADDRTVVWRNLWLPLYVVVVSIVAYALILPQSPLISAVIGVNYYRAPMDANPLMCIAPLSVAVVMIADRYIVGRWMEWAGAVVAVAMSVLAVLFGYDKAEYEILRQDFLIRGSKWSEIVKRAESYQVPCNFSSESVNLALAMTGQLADRQFQFYQSGHDALLMPLVRDNMSLYPTMEACYQLGLVNESMRYAFDLQESILNGNSSGRLLKRMAECCMINGQYKVAAKYLSLLRQSLFYRAWAEEAEASLGKENWINSHPVYGRLRQYRLKSSFFYSYGEINKIFGHLYINNENNRMALEYFMAQNLLDGEVATFMHYLGMYNQKYGKIPSGYDDAARCIQSHGQTYGAYSNYVKRMMDGGVPEVNEDDYLIH